MNVSTFPASGAEPTTIKRSLPPMLSWTFLKTSLSQKLLLRIIPLKNIILSNIIKMYVTINHYNLQILLVLNCSYCYYIIRKLFSIKLLIIDTILIKKSCHLRCNNYFPAKTLSIVIRISLWP